MPYSRIARHYHLLERFTMGNALQRARGAHLAQLANHGDLRNALLIGEGNGTFLIAFLKVHPVVQLTVIDSCPIMIETAKARLRKAGCDLTKIHFQIADLREADLPEASYDLIVTHFFFDNFDQATVDNLVSKIARSAGKQAQWLWSDFHVPPHGWRNIRARIWLKILYLFFGKVASVPVRQLPDAGSAIRRARFKCCDSLHLCGQLLRTSHYARSQQ